jgi:hypothetical protein
LGFSPCVDLGDPLIVFVLGPILDSPSRIDAIDRLLDNPLNLLFSHGLGHEPNPYGLLLGRIVRLATYEQSRPVARPGITATPCHNHQTMNPSTWFDARW